MDPLSGVLSLLRIRNYHSAALNLGGDWAFHFPEIAGIKFTTVVQGSCWLLVEGEPQPQRLQQGDCYLMTRGRRFELYSDMSQVPLDSDNYFRRLAEDELALDYGGRDTQLVGGRFEFTGVPAQVLLSSLPSVVHLTGVSTQASILRWALERFISELHQRKAGRSLVTEHLAHIMLVEVLREHLDTLDGEGTGWFAGLADRYLSAAIGALHDEPARRWTVEDLASMANMSRSAFAQRFKNVVGVAPMEYLTRWRMLLASDRLRNSADSISSIAFSLGYESESAFSNAFKRVMSEAPRHYQRAQQECSA
ncbi:MULTISPECIES: AraC family transcriptional regulator [Pseudomonas]|uniref:AraC family transcriptional regulator n=1 Tax=Pseudomonas chlororaphis TaxID=587753 RepID=A0A0D5XZB5_9PSED|nr:MULTISPECIES: AraC family transcriptional regulator [Pseudomonas]AJO78663.1 AraC family transcriptional regulator [Pseudomonas sp. MRSN 12121]AKA24406.1 AraC family transcriptional regulator [Pseudomonas chlororaphis]